MISANWQFWLDRLYNLKRDKRGSHERPHKPVLLLSILDLIDRGRIDRNEVALSDDLVRTFRRYFAAVRQRDDRPTIENPFYHLSRDGFWELVPVPGQGPLYVRGRTSGTPSLADLRRRVAYGRFADEFWQLLSESLARHQVREAIIARYFPERRAELQAIAGAGAPVLAEQEQALDSPPGRDAAFRRVVLEVYDYTCAACGARLLLSGEAMVEAAHIIPFNIGRNDRPTNGMALCPNHHWAMDRNLIAPCPDQKRPQGIWRVSQRLDERIHGQRELVALAGKPVIPPDEEKFYPAAGALQWREEKLASAG